MIATWERRVIKHENVSYDALNFSFNKAALYEVILFYKNCAGRR